jgi:hypothetical protein
LRRWKREKSISSEGIATYKMAKYERKKEVRERRGITDIGTIIIELSEETKTELENFCISIK